MIETRKLCKSFDGFQALRDLDVNVPRGAVYGLVGPNGAGKSTLIRHLAGIYIPDSGEVLIDGQPVFENVGIKSRVAYIPDDDGNVLASASCPVRNNPKRQAITMIIRFIL